MANGNATTTYDALSAISETEASELTAGKNANQIDYSATDVSLTITATVDPDDEFTYTFEVSPMVLPCYVDFGDAEDETVTNVSEWDQVISHTYTTDDTEYTVTVSARGCDDGTCTVTIGTPA